MNIDHYRLTRARFEESPNKDHRPEGVSIDLLVIHCISLPPEEYGNTFIEDLFTNCLDCSAHPYFQQLQGVKVSAHLVIKRTGELVQFVPFDQRAWHAGDSCFEGRKCCNDFSIGIELEGDVNHPFEPIQYKQLVKVTQLLMQEYPGLSKERIVGHSDIAPDRKDDPGSFFDWALYRQRL